MTTAGLAVACLRAGDEASGLEFLESAVKLGAAATAALAAAVGNRAHNGVLHEQGGHGDDDDDDEEEEEEDGGPLPALANLFFLGQVANKFKVTATARKSVADQMKIESEIRDYLDQEGCDETTLKESRQWDSEDADRVLQKIQGEQEILQMQ